jgi:hypothetical protein
MIAPKAWPVVASSPTTPLGVCPCRKRQVSGGVPADLWADRGEGLDVIGGPYGKAVNNTAFIFDGKHWHTLALPIGPV